MSGIINILLLLLSNSITQLSMSMVVVAVTGSVSLLNVSVREFCAGKKRVVCTSYHSTCFFYERDFFFEVTTYLSYISPA